MFGLRYRDELPDTVRQELDNLVQGLKGYLLTEHTDEGGHGAVTATSVVASGVGTFNGQHRAHVKIASAVTLTNNVEGIISWSAPGVTSAGVDLPDTGWNVGSIYDSNNPTYLTAQTKGLYHVAYSVEFTGNGTGTRVVGLSTVGTGAATVDFCGSRQGANATTNVLSNGQHLPMLAGQKIYLRALQSSGGNLDLVAGFEHTWFQLTKIG